MEALGATEDVAQLKAVLAMSAMADGRFAEAGRIFDEIERRRHGVFGSGIIVQCGRPELDLAAGRVEEGLRGYREAVHVLAHPPDPRPRNTVGYEPWVLFPTAAALSAHVRHGRLEEGAPLRADLRREGAGRARDGRSGSSTTRSSGRWCSPSPSGSSSRPPDPADLARAVRLLVLRRPLRLQPAAAQPELGARPGAGRGGAAR